MLLARPVLRRDLHRAAGPYEPIRWVQDLPEGLRPTKTARVLELIESYRTRALMANTDPLNYRQRRHPDRGRPHHTG